MSEQENELPVVEGVTEEPKKPAYAINDIEVEVDGAQVPARQVTSDGIDQFVVSSSFTDAQIDEAYNIAHFFFNDGIKVGGRAAQANFRTAIGLIDKKPEAANEQLEMFDEGEAAPEG